MTTIMRRTVRGTATALGALAIVVGTAGCGSLLGGDDDTRTDEQEQGQEQDGTDTGDSSEENGEEDASTDDSGDTSGDDAQDDEAADTTVSEDGAEGAGGTGDTSGNGLQEDEDGEDSGDEPVDTDDDADADDSDDSGTDTAAALSDADLDAASSRFVDFWEAMAAGDPETACRLVVDHDTGLPAEGEGLQACIDSFEEEIGSEDFDPSTFAAFDSAMFDAIDHGDGRAEITALGESTDILMVRAADGQWYLDGEASF